VSKSVLDKGGLALGVWQMLPGSNMSRTLARAGYDWVLVDCEHGNIDGRQCIIFVYLGDTHLLPDAAMHEAVPAITSYGVSPIVRVPDFQSWMIKRM
jgi:4-hydroxy-2-oxoheptanedioate aldolase